MKKTYSDQSRGFSALYLPACLILAAIAILCSVDRIRTVTLLAGAAMILLFLGADLRPLRQLPVALLLGYVAFSGLTGFWAMSGKFYLREFSKIFIACALFLLIVLKQRFGSDTLAKIMSLLAGVSAVFAVLSVEAAATGLTKLILSSIPELAATGMGFESGTRLTGIFGNANIMASILALGIFFSLALLCSAKGKGDRRLYAVLLSINAFAFLLSFSMGGIACFALSIVFYLIFAGKQRGSVLLRMLEGAIPAMVWGFASFPFFNREGVAVVLPLIFMVCNALTVVLLEEKVSLRLQAVLEQRQKLVIALLLGVMVLGAAYVVAGYNLSGPYTFQADALRRSAYPETGSHTLSVEATGDVQVTITSQNMSQVMMHTSDTLYQGAADQAVFTVPEGSEVCYFTFTAPDGVTIHQAQIDGTESIRLKYTLLPGFVANRLQGLWANQNAIQRTVFFQDGIKMFRQQPLLGNGVGSFETGVTSVQDFYYASRYIHNHYIQILCESGLPGVLLYVGALVSMAVLLWKRRREQENWPMLWAYPALWAALVMVAAHEAVEVSMSIITFLCFAYVTFGLIVASCPATETVPAESAKPAKKKAGKQSGQGGNQRLISVALIVLPALFLVSLGLNMAAKFIASSPAANEDEYLANLVTAATIDPYEYNDSKLSYLLTAAEEITPARQEQGDRFAAQMMKTHSNSLPRVLVYYYLKTGQYLQAIDAARISAVYSASDSENWNIVISQLRSVLIDDPDSPLGGEAAEQLLPALLEYYQDLQRHNQNSMENIRLDLGSKDFFSKVLNLAQDGQADFSHISSQMLFRSWLSCDADADGVPDQIVASAGVTAGENGAVEAAEGGSISVSTDIRNAMVAQVTVDCANPGALSVWDIASSTWFTPDTAENGQATFPMILYGVDGDEYVFQIASSVAQTLTKIEIVSIA